MLKAINRMSYIYDTNCSPDSIEQAAHGNLFKAMNLLRVNKGISKVSVEDNADDYEFQFFHSLGKFLYNKSKKH